MNQKLNNLLPFELACYEIYDKGYDPLNTIREFWSQYTIKDCQESMITVLENCEKSLAQVAPTDYEYKHAFVMQVHRLLIAYFLVHFRKISIDDMPLAFAEATEAIVADFDSKQKVHDFFNRITE